MSDIRPPRMPKVEPKLNRYLMPSRRHAPAAGLANGLRGTPTRIRELPEQIRGACCGKSGHSCHRCVGRRRPGAAAVGRQVPHDLPAAVLVTLHLSNQFKSSLDTLPTRAGQLPAGFAAHGEPLQHGRIYLAPPDRHLLVESDRIALGSGPRENNSRPAIDPMLRSAAVCCCHRTVGVVLTGTLGDGASGLWAVASAGGIRSYRIRAMRRFPKCRGPRSSLPNPTT